MIKSGLTLPAVGSVVSNLALALPEDALPAAVAALRAVPGQLRRQLRDERNL